MLIRRSRAQPTDRDITTAEYSLAGIRDDLRRRKAGIDRRATSPVGGRVSSVADQLTWFSESRVRFKLLGLRALSRLCVEQIVVRSVRLL